MVSRTLLVLSNISGILLVRDVTERCSTRLFLLNLAANSQFGSSVFGKALQVNDTAGCKYAIAYRIQRCLLCRLQPVFIHGKLASVNEAAIARSEKSMQEVKRD
jgi:hypothetical protein